MSASPKRAGFPKVAHVSRVQKIEDAVREHDGLPFGAEPFDQGERFVLREHRNPGVHGVLTRRHRHLSYPWPWPCLKRTPPENVQWCCGR